MTYQSRLLQSLDQQLQQCTERTERSRLISRRAIHLARLNQLDEAKAEIARLRGELGTNLDAGSGAWIFLAEGAIEYYSRHVDAAFDRLQRSIAVAQATSNPAAISQIGSWLAHISIERENYEFATKHLVNAFSIVKESDHAALSKLSQAAGILCGDAGLTELSLRWYKRARLHAVQEGDESALAALLYNKIVHRVMDAMLRDSLELEIPADFGMVAMEVKSSNSFDEAFGGVGLSGNTDLIRGHTLAVIKYFEQASDALGRAALDELFDVDRLAIYADNGYCLAKIGRPQQAKASIELALQELEKKCSLDDSAFAHGRIAQYMLMIENRESYDKHRIIAIELMEEFKNHQGKISKFAEFLPSPEAKFA